MVTTVADSGAGSLRQAISSANSAAGADTILFGFTAGTFPVISLLSALPVIAGDVFLDAALAVGAGPEVVLDGTTAGSAVGISITGSNVTVKGLVIRNFSSHGILVNGSNHVIANNYIGTDVTGTLDFGNGGDGVDVVSGTNNTVGPGNLVSGNAGTGVHLALGSTFGTVIGNKIGVNAAGNAAIPNLNGVLIDGDSGGNIVGGAAVGEGNQISGNIDYGIKMNSTVDGSTAAPSGFIRGNFIGTGAGGLGDLGNGKSVVFLSSSIGVRVGGTAAGEGNIISGNNTYGVEINSGSRHQLMGNWIGLDSTGTATVGNSLSGVYINGSNLNVVGSQVATARNVISGNGLHGVNLLSGGDSNTLLGNFIGTDKTGTLDLGNTGDGVRIQSVLQTTIGGGGTNAGNVISGNGGDGVFISVNSASLSVATLKANMIGMNAAGTGSVGNTGNGINISNASGGATIIGSAGSGNIIGGNTLSGIVVGTADLLTIQGNTIGKSGAANARGILLNTAAGATVGGIVAGQGNNIGFNTGNGIALGSAATAIIRGNSLHDNGALGIDLNNNGVTANDANDTDGGANGLLNFPVITTAISTGSSTIISGTYAGLASTDLNLDFYSNTAGGEAETYLGTFAITTDGSGNGTFSTTLGAVPAGRTISATATRAVSPFHTSEVSALVAQTSSTPSLTISDVTAVEGASGTTNFVFTVTLSAAIATDVTVNFATANGTATAGSDYTAASGALTFTAGQTSKTITVGVFGDTTSEATETFFVNLTSPVGATLADAQGLGTITSDDQPLVSVNDVSIAEGNSGTSNLIFTVTLNSAPLSTVTVDFATANGTASAGSDYVAATGTLTFAAGETSKTVTVAVNGDGAVESAETLFLNLTNASGGAISDAQGLGTITNDDSPAISVDDVSIAEGDGGTSNLVFTVSLNTPSVIAVAVDFATANGTATAGSDYVATSGTLTFAAGETTKTVSVIVNGDVTVEQAETLFLNLTNPGAATIADAQGLGTLSNDDTALVTITDATITEGDSGTTNMVFTVSLSNASASAITVNFATGDGTALAGSDYTATAGTLTFAAGETTKTVTVVSLGDVIVEQAETLFVNLTNPSGATISDAQGLGTITDNDTTVVTIADATIAEGNSGTTNLVFTVTLSNPSASSVTVDFATADGTALAGDDYTATTGTVTFAAGETSKTVTVALNGDGLPELTETLVLDLSNALGALVTDAQALGTITNDDTPSLTIGDISTAEGHGGDTLFTFTVLLSKASTLAVSLDFATVAGRALAGLDFAAASGRLTIPAGETSVQFTVSIAGENLVEADEAFTVVLSAPQHATIADDTAVATLINDDATTLIVAGVSLNEGDAETTNAVFVVILTAPSASDVTFDFTTRDGSAIAGSDYVFTAGFITIPAGTTSVEILVPIVGDELLSFDEAFSLDLSNVSGAIEGVLTADGAILNDDAAVTISIGDIAAGEGRSGTKDYVFTVQLSGGLEDEMSVDFASAGGTAEAGVDFTSVSGTLTIPTGGTSATISVPVLGDTDVEFNETFSVTLSALIGTTELSIADDTATGVIRNDDFEFSVAGGSFTEGGNYVVTVTLSGTSDMVETVDYATRTDTATGTDFVAAGGTLTFAPGETSATVSFAITSDTLTEIDEAFFVDLSNATAPVATGTAQIVILDENAPDILLDVSPTALEDGTDEAGRVAFKISLSHPSTLPITIHLQTIAGTATGADFNVIDTDIFFAPGQTEFESEVIIRGDLFAEANETFTLQISDINGAQVGTAVSIIDNDGLLISKNRKTATWRDLDGDLVTLTATKPILTPALFGFRFGDPFPAAPTRSGQLLESLDLTAAGAAAQGVALAFTAKRKDALGNKLVNVGAIHAAGIKLGAVSIPGDLGKIEVGNNLSKLTLGSLGVLGTSTQAAGGDLLSSVSGNLGALKVLGNFSGATLRITGDLGATTIGGSLTGSGGILAGGKIADVSIKRDILGDASNSPVRITAAGSGKTPAINSLTVGGNVQNAEILAGYNTVGALVNGGASIGKIAVLRNWVASSVSAGVDRGGDGQFGTDEDFLGTSPLIARIASIVITGGVFGTAGGGDHFGFVAEQIGKLKIDGFVQRLTSGVDTLSLGTADVIARDYIAVP